jgi:hypothetical protein
LKESKAQSVSGEVTPFQGSSTSDRILFLFLDGIGVGSPDPSSNPFAAAETPFLKGVLGGKLTEALPSRYGDDLLFRKIDPTLGYSGLPQSATGQATLLTGRNGAKLMEGHYGPWPGPTLKALLKEESLFQRVTAAGGRAYLANAYPPRYFAALKERFLKVNAPAYAAQSAGLDLATVGSYRSGRALAADLTGEHFRQLDAGLPVFTPQQAGAHLARIAADYTFTFFDFWLSDRLGHRGDLAASLTLAESLDAFLSGLIPKLQGVSLVMTSDHGNFEDSSLRTHTRAPVPLLVVGPAALQFQRTTDLTEIAPAIRRGLGLELAVG